MKVFNRKAVLKFVPVLFLSLFSIFLLTPAGNVLAGQSFSQKLYPVGEEPQEVVAADFNNDGNLDLATVDFTSLDVSILLGNGNGTFQKAQKFSTSEDPQALAVADFNGDGNLDIAVTEYGLGGPGTVAIFLGQGNGTFKAGASYTVGSLPYDVTAADFNGDGIIDLAVANNGANTISVMFGNGDGTFQTPVLYGVPEPERVLAVDLNNDGHPDLAVLAYCGTSPKICANGAVQVRLNNGDGTFGSPKYFAVGVGPDGIAAADFNNDGNMDLVVANNNFQAPSVISVLLGKGDGTFGKATDYTAGAGPAGVAITDLNGDGKSDIAVANVGDSTVSIFYGKGNGTFISGPTLPGPSGSGALSVAAGEFTSGGVPDLAVALTYGNAVAVVTNPN